VSAAGETSHQEFLADGRVDPREEFADRLLAAFAGSNDPVLVWSGFEAQVLSALAAVLPDRAAELSEIVDRLVDLLPIVRAHVYHPNFGGSFSIKGVAPVLAPVVTYTDLDEIAEGGAAAAALEALARDGVGTSERREQLRYSLLEYCKRDTLAMVELHRELRRCSEGSGE
jgi:predicted RecB family nuclease